MGHSPPEGKERTARFAGLRRRARTKTFGAMAAELGAALGGRLAHRKTWSSLPYVTITVPGRDRRGRKLEIDDDGLVELQAAALPAGAVLVFSASGTGPGGDYLEFAVAPGDDVLDACHLLDAGGWSVIDALALVRRDAGLDLLRVSSEGVEGRLHRRPRYLAAHARRLRACEPNDVTDERYHAAQLRRRHVNLTMNL